VPGGNLIVLELFAGMSEWKPSAPAGTTKTEKAGSRSCPTWSISRRQEACVIVNSRQLGKKFLCLYQIGGVESYPVAISRKADIEQAALSKLDL
jgi:hypothetical protein